MGNKSQIQLKTTVSAYTHCDAPLLRRCLICLEMKKQKQTLVS